jgi:hypothetical protein
MKIILYRLTQPVQSVVQIVGIHPNTVRKSLCNFNLRLTHHSPVMIFRIGQIKVTNTADNEIDIVPTQIGFKLL